MLFRSYTTPEEEIKAKEDGNSNFDGSGNSINGNGGTGNTESDTVIPEPISTDQTGEAGQDSGGDTPRGTVTVIPPKPEESADTKKETNDVVSQNNKSYKEYPANYINMYTSVPQWTRPDEAKYVMGDNLSEEEKKDIIEEDRNIIKERDEIIKADRKEINRLKDEKIINLNLLRN